MASEPLLELLCGRLAGVVRASSIAEQAAQHGLAGLVLEHSRRVRFEPALEQALRAHALFASGRALRVKKLLGRSLEVLAQGGIIPVVLKGYGLAVRYYPEPLHRAMSDVDLLVAPHEADRAVRLIGTLGLTPKKDADDYYPEPYRHHLSLGGSAGLVELHFRPLTIAGVAWEADELLARARPDHLEGRSVRYLRAEDELVYLALHASNHMLQRLGWLYDLKRLVEVEQSLDWGEVVRVARSTRVPALAFYALDAARRTLDVPVPEEVLHELSPGAFRCALAREVYSAENLVRLTLVKDKRAWALAKVLLADETTSVLLFSLRRLGWEARKRAIAHLPSLESLVARRAG